MSTREEDQNLFEVAANWWSSYTDGRWWSTAYADSGQAAADGSATADGRNACTVARRGDLLCPNGVWKFGLRLSTDDSPTAAACPA